MNRLIKHTLAAFAALALAAGAYAQSIDANGTLTIDNGTTVIKLKSYTNNTQIKKVVIPNTVTTIGNYAFMGCTKLTELTLPESVEQIYLQCFRNCTGIKTIYYNATQATIKGEKDNAPFAGCTGVKKVVVGEGVVKIPPTIFSQCTALQTIEIPASVCEINRDPFPKTTKVICPANSYADTWARKNGYTVENKGDANSKNTIKNGVLTIAKGTTIIADRAYAGNTEITKVIIPASVKTIGECAFMGCSNLTELTLPESITMLGLQSFKDCSNIKTIYYNATKATIKGEGTNSPFAGCTGVTKVVVSKGVVKIPPTIFSQCTALQTIDIPASVTEISRDFAPPTAKISSPARSFANQWVKENHVSLTADGTLVFPSKTTAIGNSAYQYGDKIKHIQFSSALKSIGNSAFRFCAYIDDDLVLPEGLEAIGKTAFYNCINVRRITVPASVKSIGNEAFCHNTSLVVKKGSYAHQWAIDNGYDYQFSAKGLPEGVTKVYTDFFMKTGWNQRGGKFQFAPEKERVVCENLASAMILFHYRLQCRGAQSYTNYNPKMTISQDFDANQANLDNIPRIFFNAYSDERMHDADLFLWNYCVAVQKQWIGSGSAASDRYKILPQYVPVKVVTHKSFNKTDMEKILINSFANNRPVYTNGETGAGITPYSDHGWAIDGLREKNGKLQVHCNFGWNGGCDGWYNLWEPIKNGMIDYSVTYSSFREFIPLEGDELKYWHPMTSAAKDIKVVDGHLEVPAGITELTTGFLTKNKIDPQQIKTITLPNTIKTMQSGAFTMCFKLARVNIPESVEYLSSNVFSFSDTIYYDAIDASKTTAYLAKNRTGSPFATMSNSSIKKFIIGENVRVLPAEILKQVYYLKQIIVPGNVKVIGVGAFNGSALSEVILEEGIEEIQESAIFCSNVKSIRVPSSVKVIGKKAFHDQTVIICKSGSYADKWARENGYTVRNQ